MTFNSIREKPNKKQNCGQGQGNHKNDIASSWLVREKEHCVCVLEYVVPVINRCCIIRVFSFSYMLINEKVCLPPTWCIFLGQNLKSTPPQVSFIHMVCITHLKFFPMLKGHYCYVNDIGYTVPEMTFLLAF